MEVLLLLRRLSRFCTAEREKRCFAEVNPALTSFNLHASVPTHRIEFGALKFECFPGFVFAPDFASRGLKKLNELIFNDEILLEDPKLALKSVEEEPRALNLKHLSNVGFLMTENVKAVGCLLIWC